MWWSVSLRQFTAGLLLTMLLATSLSGCGYRLRGSVVLPDAIKYTYIDSIDRYGAFEIQLADTLRANGATVADERDDQVSLFSIASVEFKQRELSADVQKSTKELELRFVVNFSVSDNLGTKLLASQSVTILRVLTIDEAAVFASAAEVRIMEEEMRREAVQQILRRLHARRRG